VSARISPVRLIGCFICLGKSSRRRLFQGFSPPSLALPRGKRQVYSLFSGQYFAPRHEPQSKGGHTPCHAPFESVEHLVFSSPLFFFLTEVPLIFDRRILTPDVLDADFRFPSSQPLQLISLGKIFSARHAGPKTPCPFVLYMHFPL